MSILAAVKSAAVQIAGAGAIPRVFQRLFGRDKIAILMYHGVVKEPLPVPDVCFVEEWKFRKHMSYVREHCDVIPLRELPMHLGRSSVRPKLAITFDDGFQNNYDVAFPILNEFQLPATIFLTTDFIGSDDVLWFCRLNDALAETQRDRLSWAGDSYDVSTIDARVRAKYRISHKLKVLRHAELLKEVGQIVANLGSRMDKPFPDGSPYRMLTQDEVSEMAASPLIDFGAHTCSHSILSRIPAADREREIGASIAAVEGMTGTECSLFAFPNGQSVDYGAVDIKTLRQQQIRIAVTTLREPNDGSVSQLEMRRYGIGRSPFAHFKLMIHHCLFELQHHANPGN